MLSASVSGAAARSRLSVQPSRASSETAVICYLCVTPKELQNAAAQRQFAAQNKAMTVVSPLKLCSTGKAALSRRADLRHGSPTHTTSEVPAGQMDRADLNDGFGVDPRQQPTLKFGVVFT